MRPQGTDQNLLDLVPERTAEWEERADTVVLRRPWPQAAWYLLPLEWLRYGLAVRRIRLDDVGSAVWRACDGHRTVGEIALCLRERFGPPVEPVEERLGVLVRQLRREGLLTYRLPERAVPERIQAGPRRNRVERLLT